MSLSRWSTLMLLGGSLLAVGAFLATFHREEVEQAVPASGRALTDRFYAASLLLEGLGLPTRLEATAGEVPTDTVQLLLAPTVDQRRPLVDPLVKWVSLGGHLIVGADVESDAEEDPLLEAFGIALVEDKQASVEPVEGVMHGLGELKAKLSTRWSLTAPEDSEMFLFKSGKSEAPLAVTVWLGKGQVTVVADGASFSNDRLGIAEHASWLEELVFELPDTPPREAVFLRGGRGTSWTTLVWRNAWFAVVSAGALLLAWLWSKSRRFGPLLPTPSPDRRSLVEHVEASGRFLWREREARSLLAAVRAALRKATHAPGPQGADTEHAAWLGELSRRSGVPPQTLALALEQDPGHDRAAFTQLMQTLQTLRKTP